MRPYYEDDLVTLYHGDCRDVLPELSPVDVTVTSPPYNQLGARVGKSGSGMHKTNGFFSGVRLIGYADEMPEDDYQSWLRSVMDLCREKTLGLVWMNHKVRYRDGEGVHPVRFLSYPIFSEVVWDRGRSVALNCGRHAPSHEGIWAFGQPHWWDDTQNVNLSVWRINPRRDSDVDGHPCPFPAEIASRCLLASCPPGGTVLDPFSGSGTVMVSSKRWGRRAIGIEIEERYCEIAARRLSQGTLAEMFQ